MQFKIIQFFAAFLTIFCSKMEPSYITSHKRMGRGRLGVLGTGQDRKIISGKHPSKQTLQTLKHCELTFIGPKM